MNIIITPEHLDILLELESESIKNTLHHLQGEVKDTTDTYKALSQAEKIVFRMINKESKGHEEKKRRISDRNRRNVAARWENTTVYKGTPTNTNQKDSVKRKESKKDLSPVCIVFDEYTRVAKAVGLTNNSLTDSRKRKLTLRIDDCGGAEEFIKAIHVVETDSFYQGDNSHGWKVDLDWLCKPDKAIGLIEKYQPTINVPSPLSGASMEDKGAIEDLKGAYRAARERGDFQAMSDLGKQLEGFRNA